LQWKTNKHYIFWLCVCSLRYPACNTHVLYCHLRHVRLYNILPHYLIKGTIFERKKKKLLSIKCVFWFSLQLLSETFLILRKNEQYMIKSVYWTSCKVPVDLQTINSSLKDTVKKNYSWRSKLLVIRVRETCWHVLRYFHLFLSTEYSEWRKNAPSLITYSDLECFAVKRYWWKFFFCDNL
jgi:hypothetical protein